MRILNQSPVAAHLAAELKRSHPIEASHIESLGFAFKTDPQGSEFRVTLHGRERLGFAMFFPSDCATSTAAAQLAARVQKILAVNREISARTPARSALFGIQPA